MAWRDWLLGALRWLGVASPPLSLGARGEREAARFLKRRGYTIVARGERARLGEIDLVAVQNRTVVFVEVKTRTSTDSGLPAEAVDEAKRRRIARTALLYLKRHELLEVSVRFDVIAITWPAHGQPQIEHYLAAFDAPADDRYPR